jgi:acyl carrier protein
MDPRQPIDPGRGFFEMGMDSLTSVELKRRLETGFKLGFSATLAFNYPTIDALTQFVHDRLFPPRKPDVGLAAALAQPEHGKGVPVDAEHYSEDDLVAMLARKLGKNEQS